jgi:Ser/Thr protein kinase RdoA (MazF antagonist)
MNRWGWNLFWSLAALNLFAVAGYQWSHAGAPRRDRDRLVDAFEARVPLTPAERHLLEDLEDRVLAKRAELLPAMEQAAPRFRQILLADTLDQATLLAMFQQNTLDRLEYLRFEHTELHQAIQQLPEEKREPLVDFLIENRLRAIRQWVDSSNSTPIRN